MKNNVLENMLSPDALLDRLCEMMVNDLFGPAGGPDEELSHYEIRFY